LFVLWYWGFNSGPCAKASILLPEPHLQPREREFWSYKLTPQCSAFGDTLHHSLASTSHMVPTELEGNNLL
jgi:hypothetical protein